MPMIVTTASSIFVLITYIHGKFPTQKEFDRQIEQREIEHRSMLEKLNRIEDKIDSLREKLYDNQS